MSDIIFVGACSFLGGMAFMFFLLWLWLRKDEPEITDFKSYDGRLGE